MKTNKKNTKNSFVSDEITLQVNVAELKEMREEKNEEEIEDQSRENCLN